MATNEQLQAAAGLDLPGYNVATSFSNQVLFLIPALRQSGASLTVLWPQVINEDGSGYHTVHVCEVAGDEVVSVYVGRLCAGPAQLVADAIGMYWGIDDAE